MLRAILKTTFKIIIGLWLFVAILFAYIYFSAKMPNPKIKDEALEKLEKTKVDSNFYYIKNNWFRKSKSGLYELYVEGAPYERGLIIGKLASELVQKQEVYFTEQIKKLVPSEFYRNYLRYLIGWFNRNLDKNVTNEYKQEIYGISKSASKEFDYLGSGYQRMLNYHAAHDIGHALQNLALVGCTSFATWNNQSVDSNLIIGRNFDFFVSDKFAEDKIVAFEKPDSGYKFMIVTWAGFIGTVSGMNEKGLNVTLNAEKSDYPSSSATPVSLVAREVLQYASNIEEAIRIASKRKMFISEAFMIGSAKDNKAVVIEKTPDSLGVYVSKQDYLICSNHFQSDKMSRIKKNDEHKKESSTLYRYNRVSQLLQQNGKNSVDKSISILRDKNGFNSINIGIGNEKAINQMIAHHSVVFEPKKGLVWVSTSPWQLGEFVAYDLNKIFSLSGLKNNIEISDSNLSIKADSFIYSKQFANFISYRKYKQNILDCIDVNLDSLIESNPNLYETFVLAGDQSLRQKNKSNALKYYRKSLTMEIASNSEKNRIIEKIEQITSPNKNRKTLILCCLLILIGYILFFIKRKYRIQNIK